ncbi:hypothetical protein SKAU_G00215800 [Synaphobranchus kaupii]|uniref:Uncharacterized protein n=1 Tax=Synaphobranchus kaupii TaxID=118154 RepID=A0A9Q1FA89_SYNKA|nr:hypothetical protein SKAU_G00215800 [Synaphobranchus kaupii]
MVALFTHNPRSTPHPAETSLLAYLKTGSSEACSLTQTTNSEKDEKRRKLSTTSREEFQRYNCFTEGSRKRRRRCIPLLFNCGGCS